MIEKNISINNELSLVLIQKIRFKKYVHNFFNWLSADLFVHYMMINIAQYIVWNQFIFKENVQKINLLT